MHWVLAKINLALNDLRNQNWWIQSCDSWNSLNKELLEIDGVWELLDWATRRVKYSRKNRKK